MEIKNVESVFPINDYSTLARIDCRHTNLQNNGIIYESRFLNKNMEVVARFESLKPLCVDQLCENRENLFLLHNIFDNEYKIIRVQNGNQKIIYTCQDIEEGIEDGCFAVQKHNLWGFINELGTEIIKPQYENYCAFASGLAAVCMCGKWGFINKQNEPVILFEYEIPEYSSFDGEFAPVGKNGKFGYIDKTGKIMIPLSYEQTYITCQGAKIFPVKNNNKWGFIDINENLIIPFEFDELELNGDGYPYYSVSKYEDYANPTKKSKTYGLVDPKIGKLIIPCIYNSLCPNPNSICASIITSDNEEKFGVIDYQNNKITEFIYDRINEFSSEGFYKVKSGKKRGYLDENGNIRSALEYVKTDSFCGGFVLTRNKDLNLCLINTDGEEILTFTFRQDIYNLGAGYILGQIPKNSKYEIIKVKK